MQEVDMKGIDQDEQNYVATDPEFTDEQKVAMIGANPEFPDVGSKRKTGDIADPSIDDEEGEEPGDGEEEEESSDGEEEEESGEEESSDGEEEEESDDEDIPCFAVADKIYEGTDENFLDYFDAEGDEKEAYRNRLIKEKFPVLRKYLKQVYDSQGFDIEDFPGFMMGLTPIAPLAAHCSKSWGFDSPESKPEYYDGLANLAVGWYNKLNDTAYEDAKFVKVNLTTGCYMFYYLTFTAVDPKSRRSEDGSNVGGTDDASGGTRHTFQTKIEHGVVDRRNQKFCSAISKSRENCRFGPLTNRPKFFW